MIKKLNIYKLIIKLLVFCFIKNINKVISLFYIYSILTINNIVIYLLINSNKIIQ